jgi:hypothetical protein
MRFRLYLETVSIRACEATPAGVSCDSLESDTKSLEMEFLQQIQFAPVDKLGGPSAEATSDESQL